MNCSHGKLKILRFQQKQYNIFHKNKWNKVFRTSNEKVKKKL